MERFLISTTYPNFKLIGSLIIDIWTIAVLLLHQRKLRVFPPVDRRTPSPGNGDRCKPENVITFFPTKVSIVEGIFLAMGDFGLPISDSGIERGSRLVSPYQDEREVSSRGALSRASARE